MQRGTIFRIQVYMVIFVRVNVLKLKLNIFKSRDANRESKQQL